MSDPIKPMPSHESDALSDEDYQQLNQLFMQKDPRAQKILQSLSPEELHQFGLAIRPKGPGDPTSNRVDSAMFRVGQVGVAPEDLLAGGLAARAMTPAVGAVAGKLPGALKHGVGAYAGMKAAEMGANALGLPPWAQELAGWLGLSVGGSMGGRKAAPVAAAADEISAAKKPSFTTTAPMSAAEYGGPRPGEPGGPTRLKNSPDPSNLRRSITMPDIEEQVTRGVQNTFKGVAHIEKPGATTGKGAKFAETSSGADALDALMNATGRERPLGAAGQGMRPPEPSDAYSRSERAIEELMNSLETGPMKPGQFSEQLKGSVKRRKPKK